jgi:hypothetical protein
VERRGDKAVTADPKIWRALIAYAPPFVILGAAYRCREERRSEREAMRRAAARVPRGVRLESGPSFEESAAL